MALSHIEGIKEYLKQSEINFHRIRIISNRISCILFKNFMYALSSPLSAVYNFLCLRNVQGSIICMYKGLCNLLSSVRI